MKTKSKTKGKAAPPFAKRGAAMVKKPSAGAANSALQALMMQGQGQPGQMPTSAMPMTGGLQ